MTRRRLLLAGGTVVIAVHGLCRRRKRASRGLLPSPRSHATAAVPLLLPHVTLLAWTWDVGSVLSGAWGFFTSAAGDVKDWVLAQIDAAGKFLTGLINTVETVLSTSINFLTGSVSWMASEVNNVANAVGGVIVDTYEMLDGAFANFRQQAKAMLEGAWNNVLDFVRDLIPDAIKAFFGDLWDNLVALAGIGFDGISFLLNLIDDPIGFLWNLLRDVVQDAIDVALGGITDLFAVLLQIWHILEWLASHADEITTEVLETLWGILKWIVTHIDDFTIDAFNDVLNMTPERFAEKMIEAMDANRAGIEEKFASWLR